MDMIAHQAKWVAMYNEHCEAGLCTAHGTYDGQFKIYVVEYMHSTGSSARQTAAHRILYSNDSLIFVTYNHFYKVR